MHAERGFGRKVAIWGGTVVISHPVEDVKGKSHAGALYLWRGGKLSTLSSPQPLANGRFGKSLLIQAGRLIAQDKQAIYIKERQQSAMVRLVSKGVSRFGPVFGLTFGTGRSRMIKILPSPHGLWIVSHLESDKASKHANDGAVYYWRTGSKTGKARRFVSTHMRQSPAPRRGGVQFGWQALTRGNTIAVSSKEGVNKVPSAGAVYVLRPGTGGTTRLVSTTPSRNAWFGRALAYVGRVLYIGSDDTVNGMIRAGAVHRWSSGQRLVRLVSKEPSSRSGFGRGLILFEKSLLILAQKDTVGGVKHAGGVYVISTGKPLQRLTADRKSCPGKGSLGCRFGGQISGYHLTRTHQLSTQLGQLTFGKKGVFWISSQHEQVGGETRAGAVYRVVLRQGKRATMARYTSTTPLKKAEWGSKIEAKGGFAVVESRLSRRKGSTGVLEVIAGGNVHPIKARRGNQAVAVHALDAARIVVQNARYVAEFGTKQTMQVKKAAELIWSNTTLMTTTGTLLCGALNAHPRMRAYFKEWTVDRFGKEEATGVVNRPWGLSFTSKPIGKEPMRIAGNWALRFLKKKKTIRNGKVSADLTKSMVCNTVTSKGQAKGKTQCCVGKELDAPSKHHHKFLMQLQLW